MKKSPGIVLEKSWNSVFPFPYEPCFFMIGHNSTAVFVEWFLRLNIFILFFITISERQEERLKNNNRDLSMVSFIKVIVSLAFFSYIRINHLGQLKKYLCLG